MLLVFILLYTFVIWPVLFVFVFMNTFDMTSFICSCFHEHKFDMTSFICSCFNCILTSDSCETLDLVWLKQSDISLLGFEKDELVFNDSEHSNCRAACIVKYGDPYTCESFTVSSQTGKCVLLTGNKRNSVPNITMDTNAEYYEWMCKNSECLCSNTTCST